MMQAINAIVFAAITNPGHPGPRVYSGREHQLSVPIPRMEAEVAIDGRLDEDAWRQAALLTGFSQYAPTDGLAASDSTEVLVWYSSTAIYFGIRAFEAHGSVTATLADRDRIFGDDNVQILLGTFHDGRQAVMFAVNPLGVQADGALLEGRNTGSTGLFGGGTVGREQADLSPDYVWQSRGRVTEGGGYEVEIRIPFKSLRFQPAREQSWNLNVVRQVKHSGFEDSWAPALRASPSFLNQSGEIVDLSDLHRGLVMDVNPEATEKVTGQPGVAGYAYTRGNPQLGGNVRWGISNSLAANGTVHPDFSQVESDAGQIAFDPRQALFFPEKRPFFLEGSELFAVPGNLIYTRRIVQPVAAAKLTGNVGGTDIGVLSAVDDRFASASGSDHPIFNVLRLQRRLSPHARLGLVYTDQMDGDNSNRVAGVDGRVTFGGIYSLSYQLAGSRTHLGGVTTRAPLWSSNLTMQGHHLGMSSGFSGIGDEFRTASGFIGRAGIVHAFVDPSWTAYGHRGDLVERLTADVLVDGIWQYQRFIHGRRIQDQKLHLNGDATLRGGWDVSLGVFIESFGYDSLLFANYRLEVPRTGGGLDTIPFTGQPTIGNAEWLLQVTTPQWRHFGGSGYYLQGHDENFFEWASARLRLLGFDVTWRPTDRLRTELSYYWQQINRRTDGSLVNVARIPRIKLEYQVSRPFFVRLVGQYIQDQTDSLRDDSRTGAPILIVGPTGIHRTTPQQTNTLHADVLLSYQPVPGSVILAGYGSNMIDGAQFGFRRLTRTDDAFFAKWSWLFRL